MRLQDNGIDVFYIDESHDRHVFVVTAICIPLLRKVEGVWTITWPAQFEAIRSWRRNVKATQKVPTNKELHGVKLLGGRGNFLEGKHNFTRPKAAGVYRRLLESFDFLPEGSIMSAAATRSYKMYGNERLEAAMFALFQRMRTKCSVENVNAITFFDQGHPEYRKLYRVSQKYLPTGSRKGAWQSGQSAKNLPMDMFFEDGNEKQSNHCFFTQVADLVAYAAFLKIRSETGSLLDWQERLNAGNIYDSLPSKFLNKRASAVGPRDAIVRLK